MLSARVRDPHVYSPSMQSDSWKGSRSVPLNSGDQADSDLQHQTLPLPDGDSISGVAVCREDPLGSVPGSVAVEPQSLAEWAPLLLSRCYAESWETRFVLVRSLARGLPLSTVSRASMLAPVAPVAEPAFLIGWLGRLVSPSTGATSLTPVRQRWCHFLNSQPHGR